MEIKETFQPKSQAEWRNWLSQNFRTSTEIWLVYAKVAGRLSYTDMTEEALCFGWIDSTHKKLDEQLTALRFSPRRKNSPFSQLNIERLRHLLPQGLIHPDILPLAKSVIEQEFIYPEDIMEEIRADPMAWEHFQRMPDGYKRLKIFSIDNAREDPGLFRKRLNKFLLKTRQNQLLPGSLGSDKYYGQPTVL